jgi:phosphopantetheine--protein transferase-like protein
VAIGIDIEHLENLPAAGDAWGDPFYKENFTAAEMAYCQRQGNPRESFCGIWCAKEAVLKCGGEFAGARPADLEIGHDDSGRPMLRVMRNGKAEGRPDCEISISHSHGLSVAVCVKRSAERGTWSAEPGVQSAEQGGRSAGIVVWVAFGLGLLNLLLLVALLLKR